MSEYQEKHEVFVYC